MKLTKVMAKELTKLFKSIFRNDRIVVSCLHFDYEYIPERGDEVATYKYKFHIIIDDKLYVYDGWCYPEDIKDVPGGIFAHWLLSNCEIYTGPSSAWYNMYVGMGNIQRKEAK